MSNRVEANMYLVITQPNPMPEKLKYWQSQYQGVQYRLAYNKQGFAAFHYFQPIGGDPTSKNWEWMICVDVPLEVWAMLLKDPKILGRIEQEITKCQQTKAALAILQK